MFGLFKAKNPYEQHAHEVYAALLTRMREPLFYRDYGVKDSFEGRFDLLCLHAFMVIHVVLPEGDGDAFNQTLFDIMFVDMDQSLRESGKGDVGVRKHMRRMMKGFNGRMHAYEEAYDDKAAFEEVLRRNVFAGDAEADVKPLAGYVRKMIKSLTKRGAADIMNGEIILDEIN